MASWRGPRAIGVPAFAWPEGIHPHCVLRETENLGTSFSGTQIGEGTSRLNSSLITGRRFLRTLREELDEHSCPKI
jgi:hypothetical protein